MEHSSITQTFSSPLLRQAVQCRRNRRRLSKKIHKKNRVVNDLYNKSTAAPSKPLDLASLLRNCHLPHVLADCLLTKRTAGIGSLNSLLTLAAKAMSQQHIGLEQLGSYSSMQEAATEELLSEVVAGSSAKQGRVKHKAIMKRGSERFETNYEYAVIQEEARMESSHESILNSPLNVNSYQLDSSDTFIKML